MDPTLAALGYSETGQTAGTGSAIQGHAPIVVAQGGSMQDAVNSVWDWLNKPFSRPMSPVGIGLVVGSVLIAVILWNLVLYHVRIAAETL